MAKCPRCGADVAAPVRIWPIPSRKPAGADEKRKSAGIFACPTCRARFRAAVDSQSGSAETASVKNMVERIKSIRGGLLQTLKNLHEKIQMLETERANLMTEIDKLRRVAETRANALESEVTMLREEVKSLRDLLGYQEEQQP